MAWYRVYLSCLLAVQARFIPESAPNEVTLNDESSICGNCGPFVPQYRKHGFNTFSKLIPSCNIDVTYYIDGNGCRSARIACKGYQVSHMEHSSANSSQIITKTHRVGRGDIAETSSFTQCVNTDGEDRWSLPHFTCEVAREVENSLPCPSEPTNGYSTAETFATTSTEERHETTMVPEPTTTEEQRMTSEDPSTALNTADVSASTLDGSSDASPDPVISTTDIPSVTTEEDCATTETDELSTTSVSSTANPVCGTCQRLTTGQYNDLPGQAINTCNQQIEYSTDNGCEQVSVSCTGYGPVIIGAKMIGSEGSQTLGFRNATSEDGPITAKVIMSCLEDGWNFHGNTVKFEDYKLNCLVAREVENALPCCDETSTPSTYPSTEASSSESTVDPAKSTSNAPPETTSAPEQETTRVEEQTTTDSPSSPIVSETSTDTSSTTPSATTEEDCVSTETDVPTTTEIPSSSTTADETKTDPAISTSIIPSSTTESPEEDCTTEGTDQPVTTEVSLSTNATVTPEPAIDVETTTEPSEDC